MVEEFSTLELVAQQFPEETRRFIVKLVRKMATDVRISAILMAGSPLTGSVDQWSDVDLIAVCADAAYTEVMANRMEFASSIGTLLTAFTGEHVGEPRLLICLYDRPLVHVDIKFIRVSDINPRVEDPLVLWDRTGKATQELKDGTPAWPNADLDWFEDRAWIWLHYGLAKIGRGELYEALNMLTFFRENVIGPLVAKSTGRNQRGVRYLDKDEHLSGMLVSTTASLDRKSLLDAYEASTELYQTLYESLSGKPNSHPARRPVRSYLAMVRAI